MRPISSAASSTGGESEPEGLEEGDYAAYAREHKMVTMFSGCRDDQTSADANIAGMSEGAMSWAFLETMKRLPSPSYLEVNLFLSRSRIVLMRTDLAGHKI